MPVSNQKSVAVSLPFEGHQGEIPEPTQPLADEARAMWDRWWRTPMATQWSTTADVYPLTRLALMYEHQRTEGVSDRVTVEMRQMESQFGLSPKGRKELGWTIAAPLVAVVDAGADEIEQKRKERRQRLEAS